MSYLVLARKWRPQNFHDLTGQEHVALTLKNAIESGRVAHAFLFTGARGVGKTSSARILAKTLNCVKGPTTEPCNVCPSCVEITEGNSVDVLEIDGASNNGVDEIRELRDSAKYLPSSSRYKIFIIDEVHMLSNSAFNALLKTLEEPPSHIKFIFATTEPHKLPITILSRCQRFDFKRIPLAMIAGRLRYILDQEKVTMSDAAIAMVARKGDGSMRDALSALDQVLAFCGDTVADGDVAGLLGTIDRALVISTIRLAFERKSSELIDVVKKVDENGCNMRYFCHELIDAMRSLLLVKVAPGNSALSDLSDRELEELAQLAKEAEQQTIQRALSILLKCDAEMAFSSFARLVVEMALLKMATMQPAVAVDELLERLKILERTPPSASVASSSMAADSSVPHYQRPPQSQAQRPFAPSSSSEAQTRVVQPPPPPSGERSWAGFVAYVRGRKPILAAKLEKGSPVDVQSGVLKIGYQSGSFEINFLREADSQKQLETFSAEYYGQKVAVSIVTLSGEAGNTPISLAEKKTLESDAKERALKEAVQAHPFMQSVLEQFGGEIVEYKTE